MDNHEVKEINNIQRNCMNCNQNCEIKDQFNLDKKFSHIYISGTAYYSDSFVCNQWLGKIKG